jgi:ribonuclease J
VFVTHGHEDHIGALPYLLSELTVPIWGPAHALGLARHRLAEHELDASTFALTETVPRHCYQVGPFEVEPVRVAHSIVEATALAIKTRAGTVVHTGDFNLDPDPPDGEPTDEARLREIGDAGVRLLLSDSTNIDVENRAGSERSVGESLERLIEAAPGRVFVVMFASNIQRLMLLGDTAARTGRKLCLLGRSLQTQVEVCHSIGRLRWPSNLLVSIDQARDIPKQQLIVLAGGSQAEKNSGMRRVASGTHPAFQIEDGDAVIFSSRIIPGNDRPVFEMMADLLRRGARLHTRITDPGVHTSGHAGRSEQLRMLDLIRPSAFVPVHGTLHHLMRHADLARSRGVRDVLVIENGASARVAGDELRRADGVPYGKISIAQGGEPLDAETLRRRSELARSGLVVVALGIDGQGRITSGPRVTARGVPGVDDDERSLCAIAKEVALQFERVRGYKNIDLEDELRRAARRRVLDVSGCRPVVEIQLLNLD